ncbi:putative transcriptional activator srcap-like protein [Hirsutella rhossiliensis]|uniref:Transcriptional activator srcap-like protein n=1 Tax=Hirsutella rhossiliensis TaxID=111463 RepID=A0A9P8MYN7_9HYPO|nr:putative transcriptional activator srcap-like protein [Hirsutella rhossiliensis]KAH0963715.1 putative transcriptional activator srcap-like protein [Hirsutella rhossiliensis]
MRAFIELSQNSFTIWCTANAVPISPGSVPQPCLDEVVLDASFAWGESKLSTLDVVVNAIVVPSANSDVDVPAVLTGSLSYDSSTKSWGLKGSIKGLYASVLVEFLDQDAKDHVGPLIESIAIDTLTAEYKYGPVSEGTDQDKTRGSKFIIKGDLLIASFRLSLNFRHDRDGFNISAALNPKDKDAGAKIGDVLAAILGSDIELPDFVYNTILVGDREDVFKMAVEKRKTTVKNVTTKTFQFLAQFNINQLHIDFAQLHNTEWAATAPSKRLVKVAISGFTGIEVEIPLIGTLTQPLDELYFQRVQDPPRSNAAPGQLTGLTRLDIDQLNSSLSDRIMVRDKIKPDQQNPKDLLAAGGCHFAVIIRSTTVERSCLLNYNFMKPKTSTSTTGKAVAEADDGGPSAQAPFKKVAGPLSISSVGFKYKDKKLAIILTAEFDTLHDFPRITPNLEGLAASFDKPPMSIASIIRHGSDGTLDYFADGLNFGWRPYEFQAAGFYGIMTPAGSRGELRTVFVFAKLTGPLVTLQFAEIAAFPFIASLGLSGNDNALQVLEKLVDPRPGGWFQPLDKVYWAALGMRIKAFQILSVDAVSVSNVGQFVFTLGGYHQAYRVPVGYPNPPRLSISWSLGGGLIISGQAYFAITPKACMAGGRLHASFSAGPISAWFDAFADFLINYKPLHFDMQAGLSVGVGFSIDIWFIHIRISVEIGAELYLWGPPVVGRVHVDFWIAAFDINFGDYLQHDNRVTLSQFYLLVLHTSSPASMASADKALLAVGNEKEGQEKELKAALSRPKNEGHNFLAQSGLMNPFDKPEREQNEP